ncbi:hypothetical protein P7K49_011866 [Saguinus oedipus]|uniref:Uncharacterized protein n=1 Tax=Saguinus oedipus TaxID=9490 RepID=A0ABQ9VTD9_SAGOE|nr:hypothetical protein P7K49_011866 [Saguinus oedipus]
MTCLVRGGGKTPRGKFPDGALKRPARAKTGICPGDDPAGWPAGAGTQEAGGAQGRVQAPPRRPRAGREEAERRRPAPRSHRPAARRRRSEPRPGDSGSQGGERGATSGQGARPPSRRRRTGPQAGPQPALERRCAAREGAQCPVPALRSARVPRGLGRRPGLSGTAPAGPLDPVCGPLGSARKGRLRGPWATGRQMWRQDDWAEV